MSIEYMYEINKIAETDTQLEITRKAILKFIQFVIDMFLGMIISSTIFSLKKN